MNIIIANTGRTGILHEDMTGIKTDPKRLREENPEILHELNQLCKAKQGVGVAAPQVGMRENFFFVTAGAKFPTVGGKKPVAHLCCCPTWAPVGEQKAIGEEGCLSLPGRVFVVARYRAIMAQWTNAVGHPQKMKLQGLAARVFQHEADHLRGVILTDYAEEKIQSSRP